jgi:hypothetical protein
VVEQERLEGEVAVDHPRRHQFVGGDPAEVLGLQVRAGVLGLEVLALEEVAAVAH